MPFFGCDYSVDFAQGFGSVPSREEMEALTTDDNKNKRKRYDEEDDCDDDDDDDE